MRVVIAGGSGLLGTHLASALKDRGDEPIILSRDDRSIRTSVRPDIAAVRWNPSDPHGQWTDFLRGARAVVNLAGSSVGNWPWTSRRMRKLVESRLQPTQTLVEAIARLDPVDRPTVLVSASGTDVYEGRDAEPATETTRPAETFLARLCLNWEATAQRAETARVRVVLARTSLVVARSAPALRRFAMPVRMFVGGPIGGGHQWISWIHIADLTALMLTAIDREDVSGIVNFTSTDAKHQTDFSATIARVLHRPFWLPLPAALVRLVLAQQATLPLGSRRVWPAVALQLGFEFRYPVLEDALRDALS